MELHRFGFKVFATDSPENGELLDPLALIPVFHRWIQHQALADLLIDVADYSHMHAGPGILLVAHEGNYGYDETGNRWGLVYYNKRPLAGKLGEKLTAVCHKLLTACHKLEQEPELQGRLKFRGNQIQFFANDRLLAPNNEQTAKTLDPALQALLTMLYPEQIHELTHESDSKERFSVTATVTGLVSVTTLLGRF